MAKSIDELTERFDKARLELTAALNDRLSYVKKFDGVGSNKPAAKKASAAKTAKRGPGRPPGSKSKKPVEVAAAEVATN